MPGTSQFRSATLFLVMTPLNETQRKEDPVPLNHPFSPRHSPVRAMILGSFHGAGGGTPDAIIPAAHHSTAFRREEIIHVWTLCD